LRGRVSLADRKWIFNPNIETEAEFERRRKLNLTAPWEDHQIQEQIRRENPDKERIVYGPQNLGKLIDESGEKLGIIKDWYFSWKPL
jgi:hypothetical protein